MEKRRPPNHDRRALNRVEKGLKPSRRGASHYVDRESAGRESLFIRWANQHGYQEVNTAKGGTHHVEELS